MSFDADADDDINLVVPSKKVLSICACQARVELGNSYIDLVDHITQLDPTLALGPIGQRVELWWPHGCLVRHQSFTGHAVRTASCPSARNGWRRQ